jgi:hypothetical protein
MFSWDGFSTKNEVDMKFKTVFATFAIALMPVAVFADEANKVSKPIRGTICRIPNINMEDNKMFCSDKSIGLGWVSTEELYAKGWRIVQMVNNPALPTSVKVYVEEQR